MRNSGHTPSRQSSSASTQDTIVGPSSDISYNKNGEQSLVLCDRRQRNKQPRAIPEARGYTVPHGIVAVATRDLHAERNVNPGSSVTLHTRQRVTRSTFMTVPERESHDTRLPAVHAHMTPRTKSSWWTWHTNVGLTPRESNAG